MHADPELLARRLGPDSMQRSTFDCDDRFKADGSWVASGLGTGSETGDTKFDACVAEIR